jgi:hypothetical protein
MTINDSRFSPHESRVPLTLLGLICIAAGVFFFLNPESPMNIDRSSLGMFAGLIPDSIVNLQKLILGQTLTLAGAIFLAAAWRPR